MKKMHLVLMCLALVAVSFALAGCPKDKMMKGDLSRPSAVERIG